MTCYGQGFRYYRMPITGFVPCTQNVGFRQNCERPNSTEFAPMGAKYDLEFVSSIDNYRCLESIDSPSNGFINNYV